GPGQVIGKTVTAAQFGGLVRPLLSGLFFPAKLEEHGAIVERYGKAEWMRQAMSEGHRLLGFLERLVGIAQKPQDMCHVGSAKHSDIRSESKQLEAVSVRVVLSHCLF